MAVKIFHDPSKRKNVAGPEDRIRDHPHTRRRPIRPSIAGPDPARPSPRRQDPNKQDAIDLLVGYTASPKKLGIIERKLSLICLLATRPNEMTLTITHQVLRYVFRNTKESEFAIKDKDNEPRSFKKQIYFCLI